jgi:hypothetical protein
MDEGINNRENRLRDRRRPNFRHGFQESSAKNLQFKYCVDKKDLNIGGVVEQLVNPTIDDAFISIDDVEQQAQNISC